MRYYICSESLIGDFDEKRKSDKFGGSSLCGFHRGYDAAGIGEFDMKDYRGFKITKEKTYGLRRVNGFARPGSPNARTVQRRVLMGNYTATREADYPMKSKTLKELKRRIDGRIEMEKK